MKAWVERNYKLLSFVGMLIEIALIAVLVVLEWRK